MKITLSEKVFGVFNSILMIFLSISMIYPFLNQMAISLNDGNDTMFGGISLFPRKFTLVNYTTIFASSAISNAVCISVSRVVIGTIIALLVTIAAAYSLSKRDLPFRKFFIWVLIIPMYVGAGLIPTYMLYRDFSLINNYFIYIIPGAFSFYNMLIIRTFIEGLPASLEESAIIDGANEVKVLSKIILPLCMPVVATVSLWLAVGHWNDWMTTLLFVNKSELFPLQYILMQIVKESELIQKLMVENAMMGNSTENIVATPEAVKSATLIIATLPIIMLYPFLQKYFIKGVVLGAVKE